MNHIWLGVILLLAAFVLVLLYALKVDDAFHSVVYFLTAILAYLGVREIMYGPAYNTAPN